MVKVTGRKKLIMAALWTETCSNFPALDASKLIRQPCVVSSSSAARWSVGRWPGRIETGAHLPVVSANCRPCAPKISLFEGPSELPAVGHLGERLAPLLALAYGLSRIAEWDNRQHVQIFRDSQERLDLI